MESELLRTLVAERARRSPDAVACYEPSGAPVTFRALQDRVEAVGRRIPAGSRRVGIRISNDVDGVAVVQAAWQRDATPVLISGLAPDAEAARRARETRCDVVVDPAGRGDELDLGEAADPGTVDGEAVVVFTSGTTGRPKAAILTFDSIAGSLESIAEGAGLDPGGRAPAEPPRSPTPVFVSLAHVGGLLAIVNSVHQGKPFVVFDKFRVSEVFDLVDRFQLRLLRLTPAMVYDLAFWEEPRSLEPVRTVTVGSAALSPDVRRQFEERYGAIVLQSYGQTELTGAIAFERYADVKEGDRPPSSVGRVAPGVEVEIVGPDGRGVAPGEVGEIRARSSSAFAAYIDDGELVDPKHDGWHSTGDLGRLDGPFLTIVGRADDTIICGGFNVYPAMVEAALTRIDGVTGSVVAGVHDDRLGEVPVALVTLAAGAEGAVDELRSKLRDELAPYEVPRRIEAVREIPITDGGKPDRAAVREVMEARGAAVSGNEATL